LVQPVDIDGVSFELSAGVFGNETLLQWSQSSYTGVFPGIPGISVKKNRFVTISTQANTGVLTQGEISQVSLGTLLRSQRLQLIVR
jgi:hypothetical protein